jgi:hypothetical protein
MQAWDIWTRLLWKEWRQGRAILGVLLAVPPVTFLFAELGPNRPSFLGEVSLLLGAFAPPLLTALWAAAKASRTAPAGEFAQAHLPVRPLAPWGASFLTPLLVAGLCGAWYGICARALPDWHRGSLAPSAQAASLGAACLATTFAASYLVSITVSFLPAVLVGAFSAFGTAAVLLDLFLGGRRVHFPLLLLYCWRLAFAGMLASFAFAVLGRKRSLRPARAGLLCLALGLLVLPPLPEVLTSLVRQSAPAGGCVMEAPDGSFFLNAYADPGHPDHVLLHFSDRRNATTRERAFRRSAIVIDVRDRRYVYLAQQLRGQRQVEILVWDSVTNAVRPLASLPAGRNALPRKAFWRRWGHVSPQAHYLVLALPTTSGGGQSDLWVVDLRSGRSAVVLPDQLFATERASWRKDRVILSGFGNAVVVDLKAARARFLEIPLMTGGGTHG